MSKEFQGRGFAPKAAEILANDCLYDNPIFVVLWSENGNDVWRTFKSPTAAIAAMEKVVEDHRAINSVYGRILVLDQSLVWDKDAEWKNVEFDLQDTVLLLVDNGAGKYCWDIND